MRPAAACAVMLLAAACTERPEGVDLIRRGRLVEASASGLAPDEARGESGSPRRIHDGVRASLPAGPPSRYRIVTDVPDGARLVVAAGVPGRYRDASAVEFVASVRHQGRETTVLSRLVDPANRVEDRRWVPLEADLSPFAGRAVEIVLQTRGFDDASPPDRAFWGTPTLVPPRDGGAPLVVVYLVDALRADHLPLFGYARDTAPALSAFARDSVVFDQAIAASSWTKPSVASLFTSLLPRDHGCARFYAPLDPALVTLAERLHEQGWATGAVVANPHVGAKGMRFDQGFDHFEADTSVPDEKLVDAALAFLDARRGQPAFLYVHAMSPHAPYLPPPPFDGRFPPFPGPGRLAARPSEWTPADRDWIVGQYDGAIAYADQQFGRFVRALRGRGLYDRATIVFLADHGEEFLDHGEWQHGLSLFDELVRVPLVLKLPGRREAGRRVARQVQLVDVLPTILKVHGIPLPPAIEGRPLDESFGASGRPERPAVLETSYFDRVAYGARTREAKYVRRFHPDAAELFFDLPRDPGERRARDAGTSAPVRALKAAAESSLSSGAHHRLRVDGAGAYDLRLRTTGFFEIVERAGLLEADRVETADDAHELVVRLGGGGGRSRRVEVEFATRPRGAPVWLDGRRDGRRLRPADIRVAAEGRPAGDVPLLVPNGEQLASELGTPFGLPPPGPSGVSIGLVASGGKEGFAPIDDETREVLKTLGYLP